MTTPASAAARLEPTTAARGVRGNADLLALPSHALVAASVLLGCLTVLSLRIHEPRDSQDSIAIGCGAAVIGLMLYTRYVLRLPWISASVVYLMLFWVFHYGLAFTAVLFPEVLAPIPAWESAWLFRANTRMALVLALLGATGFVLGVALTSGPPIGRHDAPGERTHDVVLYRVGWLVMLAGIGGTLLALVQTGGLEVLTMRYVDLRFLLSRTIFQHALDFSQLGCLLALCGATGRRWMLPLVVWIPVAAVMLVLGMRTEAMIPFVSFAIVMVHRGVRLRWTLVAPVVLAFLVVLPAIKVFRVVGFGNRSLVNWTEVSPLDTFTELGGTLQAARAYVDWIEEGEEHLLGASYLAPLDRQLLVRLLPDRERIPYDRDERVPGRHVWREGAVGLSATGEAYYNFGAVGPFIYFAAVGALFGWLERRAVGSFSCALLGVVISVFFFNIRGEWLPVPAQTAVGLALLAFCYVLSLFVRSRDASLTRRTPAVVTGGSPP